MDRFQWSDGILTSEEQLIVTQGGIRIYDGQNKTTFDRGKLQLTAYRFLWKDDQRQKYILSLPLSLVVLVEEEAGGITKNPKIIVHVSRDYGEKVAGPVASSGSNFIRFSFQDGGHKEFFKRINETLNAKMWIPKPTAVTNKKAYHSGIAGIEKDLSIKKSNTDSTISVAFEDLSNLMIKAKEMVTLSKNISAKLRDRPSETNDDETIQFKSYLLSLGISDPVTRDSHGTGDKYFQELSKQISEFMQQPLKECGGVMTLTDAYCRINRARGFELLSPDDLLSACHLLKDNNLPVRFRIYDSGVMVLQLQSCNEEALVLQTEEITEAHGSLSADELSKIIGLSVVLAKERLLAAETVGRLCRDDSVAGLRFYPNRFVTQK